MSTRLTYRRISLELSPQERQNLDGLASQDHRLKIALRVAGQSKKITQVLAGGVLLLDRYEHASDPSSQAIITAAMDARRMQYYKPLPVELLKEAAPGYLTDEQRVGTGEWFADAIAKAAEPVHGISAMTPCRTDPGVGEANAYILHDYLSQYALTPPRHNVVNLPYIRNAVINQLLREAESGDYSEIIELADEMWMAGREEESIPWLERAMASGKLNNEEYEHIDCMERLARALEDVGRKGEALELYERLRAEKVVYPFDRHARLLDDLGQEDKALVVILEGAREEVIPYMADAGDMLERADRTEEALYWHLKAAENGYIPSMGAAGDLLEQAGRTEEALRWHLEAAENGYIPSMGAAGDLLEQAGRTEEALRWHREAAENGWIS